MDVTICPSADFLRTIFWFCSAADFQISQMKNKTGSQRHLLFANLHIFKSFQELHTGRIQLIKTYFEHFVYAADFIDYRF